MQEILICLWARFRRWCHCMWHLLHLRAHRAIDIQDDFERFGGRTKCIACDCGVVFWGNRWLASYVPGVCEHDPHEDCMFCVVCGVCKESLDSNDVCAECGGKDESDGEE